MSGNRTIRKNTKIILTEPLNAKTRSSSQQIHLPKNTIVINIHNYTITSLIYLKVVGNLREITIKFVFYFE